MGCDCCKIVAPSDYEKCQVMQQSRHEKIAPCGGTTVGGVASGRGSNYTPPKKKRKREK